MADYYLLKDSPQRLLKIGIALLSIKKAERGNLFIYLDNHTEITIFQ